MISPHKATVYFVIRQLMLPLTKRPTGVHRLYGLYKLYGPYGLFSIFNCIAEFDLEKFQRAGF